MQYLSFKYWLGYFSFGFQFKPLSAIQAIESSFYFIFRNDTPFGVVVVTSEIRRMKEWNNARHEFMIEEFAY